MKFSYQNIHTLFRINRLIVISVVIMAFASSGVSTWMTYRIHRDALQNAFAIDASGAVLPLSWEAQSANREIEALAHLEQFHRLFYGIDAATFEQHLERALWWADTSVNELYKQKKSEGLYNRLLQYSLVQKVVSIESRLEPGDNRIPFTSRLVFDLRRGEVTDTYELITTGVLIPVERQFPRNPHGLLITEFFEKSLKKLSNEP
ncbi:conjugal transfer protein TraK [Robiginitalea sediminis]|uniref:conjugal transfer protein TraK n=1 Tax=Robiginitalea sediminis TaxID=1982593 RepID=UPI000B4B9950|nr:conjugal transfer protein TraK [Robiginitalea sediminis]